MPCLADCDHFGDAGKVVLHMLPAEMVAVYRLHLYGDVYSSPGLLLRQKQLLMCAFLGEANMPEQLFGHLLAVGGLRLSSSVACQMSPSRLADQVPPAYIKPCA